MRRWTKFITVRKGANICFNLILEGGKAYKVLFTLMNIAAIVVMAAMCRLGSQAWENRGQWATMTRMNMGLMNAVIPIGFALTIISQIEYYLTHTAADTAAVGAIMIKPMKERGYPGGSHSGCRWLLGPIIPLA